MVHYHRTPSKNAVGDDIFRYFKDSKSVKEASVPPEVMDRLEITPNMDYDDQPERRRCIFCDGPQKRIRSLNMTMVDLCEWHYQHMTLGKIAAQVNKVQKEMQAIKIPKVKKQKRKVKKTQLSAMVA